jgi:plasmid stabilization system protein ParE
MTAYSVVFTEQAARELETAADWWAIHRSTLQAGRWYEGFSLKIESLSKSPERLPLADEDPEFSYELRELHYGLGAISTHRALFTIVADFVVILTIRHAAQRAIRPDDIEPDPQTF